MATKANRQIRLANRPVGLPSAETWSISDEQVADPGPGQLRVELDYISLDPAMRGWLNDVRSYVPPVGIGEVMRARGVGRVTDSRHGGFAVGDMVAGPLGVQERALSDGSGLIRVDPDIAPAPTWLGLLGYPGLTAYFGLLDVGRAKAGDVVLVSGAAGAVGSVVGQLARIHDCQVIGIAGGEEKCEWLVDDLGFTAAIDYKNQDLDRRLRELAPNGIDVFFDNVGGKTLDSALARLAKNSRIVICGAISQYNNTAPVRGPQNYLSLLVNRASMTGMMIFDYEDRFEAATAELGRWLKEGELVAREQVVDGGIDSFPEALLMLFEGANTGKLVLGMSHAVAR